MDHPLLILEQKPLRQRVVRLFNGSYKSPRSSNIIFVCGGNEDTDMRTRFCEFCAKNLTDYEIFLPEYALENILSTEAEERFDITDFEELISDLSHAVIVFPEAAGSYAETGYFSAKDAIAKRCILVLNSQYHKDSFITLGPAKKIGEKTIFHPLEQIDYGNPNFLGIVEKVKRINKTKYHKVLKFEEYNNLGPYELCCLIHEIVNILTIATVDDILQFCKVMFKNRHSPYKIKKLLSVLVGAKYLIGIGTYGHYCTNSRKPHLLKIREGSKGELMRIRLNLAELYQDYDKEFCDLIEEARDAS